MQKPPYMPLYVDDYEADTAHLTFEEDGVYNRLLRLCWRTSGCSLPDDAKWIARKMRCDLDTYHHVVDPIIREFFQKENGRIFQARQRREFNRAVELSDNRARSGQIGGTNRARNRKTLKTTEIAPSKANVLLPHLLKQPEPSQAIPDKSLKEAFLGLLGLAAAGANGQWSELPECLAEWQSYDLSENEILAEVQRIVSRGCAPETPRYFTPAMHALACKKSGWDIPRTKPRRSTFRKVTL